MKREEEEALERSKLFAMQLRTIYILTCTNCGINICNSTQLRFLNNNHVVVCSADCWEKTSVRAKVNSKLKRVSFVLYDCYEPSFSGF